MKLTEYDVIHTILDKTKTWTDISRTRLVSKEIAYRRYYTLAERINTSSNSIDYFLILLDDKPTDRFYYITESDDFGRLKFKLHPIWKSSILKNIKTNINVVIDHIEHTDDGDIYRLDI